MLGHPCREMAACAVAYSARMAQFSMLSEIYIAL